MPIIRNQASPIKLQLAKDLTRSIKRGHAWVYRQALRSCPPAAPGAPAALYDNKGGKQIAKGYYTPDSPLALRICTTDPNQSLDDGWAAGQMKNALAMRQSLFNPQKTNAYRLFNGEGDGLPGLVVDIYDRAAVVKLDGDAAANFWDAQGIADWLVRNLKVNLVYRKSRRTDGESGEALVGEPPSSPIPFTENNLSFSADLVHGQKTGFFLDQRDNRAVIGSLASGKRVANIFGYTGGFSVYAGWGSALQVVTVDSAKPALLAADNHWRQNNFTEDRHKSIAADAFDFLQQSAESKENWDMVILDPPSFAPNEASIPQASAAYTKLIAGGARITVQNGLLAAASCSSHITQADFMEICERAISEARRKASLVGIYGLPADHPAPLVMPELRYLKFVLMKLD